MERDTGTDAGGRHAWIIVAVCTVMVAMGFGAIVNVAVFLTPLAAEFGWPRAQVSAAYSIATVGTGLGGILMGHFADRIPVRRVALCGALVPGLALAGLSCIDSVLELYAYHALMGVVGVGAIMAPLNTLASRWLARNPGLAIGIVSAGGAAGQGLIPYLARHLVLMEGWREAYLTLGLAYLGLMVPLALFLRDAPRPSAQRAGMGSAAAAAYAVSRPKLLAVLSLAVAFCCICMATPIVHVASLGADLGLGGRESASLLAVMMVAGMAGRIAFGRLADRTGNLRAYFVASLGQTLLAFVFPYAGSGLELLALSAIFGAVFSGAMTAFISCAREYAPAGREGLSIGVVMFFGWLGMALGAWQGGLFYDLCGAYFQSFANASLGGAVNLALLALLFRYTGSTPLPPLRMLLPGNPRPDRMRAVHGIQRQVKTLGWPVSPAIGREPQAPHHGNH
ncbi:MAG TPA: MFS transporter [Burkholderiales bacterium]|nr:MFS transporter [Burkholderiales bacterium]